MKPTLSRNTHGNFRPQLETLEDRLLMTVFGRVDWSFVPTWQADDYPYAAAVSIYNRNSDGSVGYKIGSGALIGPNTVLTAAHVVFDTNTNLYNTNLIVVPGQVGDFKPYGAAASTSVLTVSGYTRNHDTRYDAALIYLDRNLGSYTGTFGLMNKPESYFDNRGTVNILHYPSDTLNGQYLVHSSGSVSLGTTDFIRYKGTLDTEHGSSGAPVYVYENGSRYIVGVHHQGSGGDQSGYNQAVRLNDYWYNTVVNYKNYRPTRDYADLMNRDSWFNVRDSSFSVSGSKVNATAYVFNGGTAASGSFKVHFYASSNNIISNSDIYLGSVSAGSLGAFQTGAASISATFPSNVPVGKYYIGWIIDGNNNVTEYLENNNTGLVSNKLLTVGYTSTALYRANEIAVPVTTAITQARFSNSILESAFVPPAAPVSKHTTTTIVAESILTELATISRQKGRDLDQAFDNWLATEIW